MQDAIQGESTGTAASKSIQSAIHNPLEARRGSNAPQSATAMRKIRNRFRQSQHELRGPKSGLELGPRNSRG
eukprot:459076-Alexandrium_andersonii.AAC.1